MQREIEVKNYTVIIRRDKSIGDNDTSYELSGNFYFETEDLKKDFEADLKKLFESHIEFDYKVNVYADYNDRDC